jgi:hypothetical protein
MYEGICTNSADVYAWDAGLRGSLGVSATPDGTPINGPSGVSTFQAVEQIGAQVRTTTPVAGYNSRLKIERAPTENWMEFASIP